MDDYRIFYDQHKNKLFAYLMRMTGDYHLADDIMQESFIRFLERYGNAEKSAPLLYAIARNLVVDESRRKKTGTPLENFTDDCCGDQENYFMVREEYRRMLEALQQLSLEDRELLALVAGGDCSYREIGKILGLNEAHVKVKVHRARLKLKSILNSGGD
jgi:RNA polymerase sigma-70 factor (ECF subfamily)